MEVYHWLITCPIFRCASQLYKLQIQPSDTSAANNSVKQLLLQAVNVDSNISYRCNNNNNMNYPTNLIVKRSKNTEQRHTHVASSCFSHKPNSIKNNARQKQKLSAPGSSLSASVPPWCSFDACYFVITLLDCKYKKGKLNLKKILLHPTATRLHPSSNGYVVIRYFECSAAMHRNRILMGI